MRKYKNLCKTVLGTYFKRPFSGPYSVYLGITNHCNYKCVFCKYDHFKKEYIDDPKKLLPFDMVKKCVEDLGRLGTQHINFLSWGEPFTHSHLFEIFEEIRKHKMTMGILTNGSKLSKEVIDRLLQLKLKELGVSLNAASGSMYEQIHLGRSAKVFDKIIESLLYLKKEKEKRSIKYPRLGTSFVISKINHNQIDEMVSLSKRLGVKQIRFDNVRIYSQENKCLELDRSQLDKVLDKLSRLKKDTSLKFSFRNFEVDANKILSDNHKCLPNNCYAGHVGITGINPDGNVTLCCGCGVSIGNLYEKRFIDIWRDSTVQKYREEGLRMWRSRKALFGDCCYNCRYIEMFNNIHRIFHFWKRPRS